MAERARVRNASSEKQVKNAEAQLRREAVQQDERLREIMATYNGRWWMWEHIASTGAFGSPSDPSTNRTFENIGRQDVGRTLWAQLGTVCPEQYVLMQSENMQRVERRTEPKARAADPIEETEDDGN